MEERKIYTIPGDPIALNRARMGSAGRMYDPQKGTKLAIGIYLQNQHEGLPYYEGPLHFNITFFMYIPKGMKKNTPHYHCKKPDVDNLAKMYIDIGTGILYQDDNIIAQISGLKIYDENPRVEFFITELKNVK